VLAVVAGCAQPQPPDVVSPKPFERTVIGGVVGISSTFGHVVDLDAQVEVVSSGYGWSEGPVWVNAEVGLLFSDVPGNTIYRWHPDSGTTLWLTPSGSTGSGTPGGEGGSNGLTLDAAGRLVLAQHGDRRVARLTGSLDMPAPQFETIIDAYEGQAFNSPNDLVYGSDGSLYFTDPTYGLAGPDEAELDFAGVYRLSIAGELTLIDGALTRPNGIALSPDGRTLYVANSDPGASLWMAYSVQADGHATDGRLFFDATHLVSEDNPGFPDGLSLDVAGRLFATGPGGVLVFSPEGEHLGTIRTDGPTANLAFGEDGTVLFLTSNSHLARIQTLTRGLGF
jgi:gluconolactonase